MADLPMPKPKQKEFRSKEGGICRPPDWKFSQEVAETVLGALMAGSYIDTACDLAGIHRTTFYRWLRRGSRLIVEAKRRADRYGRPHEDVWELIEPQDERGIAVFADRVRKALAQAQITHIALIRKAASKHWQAAAWMLERRYPEQWGRRRLDIEAEGAQAAGTTVSVYLPSNSREDTVTGVVIRQQPSRTPLSTNERDPLLLGNDVIPDGPDGGE